MPNRNTNNTAQIPHASAEALVCALLIQSLSYMRAAFWDSVNAYHVLCIPHSPYTHLQMSLWGDRTCGDRCCWVPSSRKGVKYYRLSLDTEFTGYGTICSWPLPEDKKTMKVNTCSQFRNQGAWQYNYTHSWEMTPRTAPGNGRHDGTGVLRLKRSIFRGLNDKASFTAKTFLKTNNHSSYFMTTLHTINLAL